MDLDLSRGFFLIEFMLFFGKYQGKYHISNNVSGKVKPLINQNIKEERPSAKQEQAKNFACQRVIRLRRGNCLRLTLIALLPPHCNSACTCMGVPPHFVTSFRPGGKKQPPRKSTRIMKTCCNAEARLPSQTTLGCGGVVRVFRFLHSLQLVTVAREILI